MVYAVARTGFPIEKPHGAVGLLAIAVIAMFMSMVSPSAAAFAIYTVGGDAACQYQDVQAAVNAAGANPGEDYVWIANNKNYSNEQITVNNQDVDIEGGFANCAAFTITDTTLLSGANNAGPIFSITGTSHVFLQSLEISGAKRASDAQGGGIEFAGTGSLTLESTTVTGNSAGYGAGIDMSPSSAGATLTLNHDVIIDENTAAVSGGGIRIEYNTDLSALAPKTYIAFNTAMGSGGNAGYGGGIEVIGPAHAEIGSPGYNGAGVIYENAAEYGGGIAVLTTSGGSANNAYVTLFTTDASTPVQLFGNTATGKGGAAYLDSFSSSTGGTSDAALCAIDFRFTNNSAPTGSAVYLDKNTSAAGHDEGSELLINQTSGLCPVNLSGYGAVRCAAAGSCNQISGNITQNSSGNPTNGATILVETSSTFHADTLSMRNNTATTLINAVGNNDYASGVTLRNCLVANNTDSGYLIEMDGNDAPLVIDNCTIADNAVGAAKNVAIYSHDTLSMTNSIVDMPGIQALDYDLASGLEVNYVLASDPTTLQTPTSIGVVQGQPTFVNEAGGDYHLTYDSVGIDFAPSNNGTTSFDLDDHQRNVDLPSVPNVHGPIDLGAYELQSVPLCSATDTIFCDGFEVP